MARSGAEKSPSADKVVIALTRTISLLVILCLATPLIVTHSTLYPFQVGKGIALRILIELAGFFYLWLCVIDPRARPVPNRLFWSVLAFAGVLVLTMLTGIDPYRSLWGDLDRMDGVFGVLHGVAAFVIAYGLFTRRDQWVWVFRMSLAASVFVMWYALDERHPWTLTALAFDLRQFQPGSTFGYTSFAATYAVFQIFFASFLIVLERTRFLRFVAAGFLLLNFLLLTGTAIRGAQVAMLAAIAVGAFAFVRDPDRSVRTRVAMAVAFTLCVGGFFGVRYLEGTSLLKSMPRAVQRMATISASATTGQTRLIALGVSWQAWKERPMLGWGPENFKVAYRHNFDPDMLTHEDIWFDRPHNKLAEVAVHSGMVGLLSYLAMFVFAAVGVAQHVRHSAAGPDRSLATLVLMLGTAYFVQDLFLFDTPVSTVLCFMSLAFAGFMGAEGIGPGNDRRVRGGKADHGTSNPVGRLWIVAAGFVVGALLVRTNVAPLRAAQLGGACVRSNEPHQAAAYFRQAIDQGSFAEDEVIRLTLHSLISTGRVGRPEWDVLTSTVQKEAERLHLQGRLDLPTLVAHGKAYNRRGNAYSSEAERVLRQAMSKAPRMHEARYELGLTLLRTGDIEGGLQMFREIVSLNDRYAKGHWILGVALVTQKQYGEGLAEVERALALGWKADDATMKNLYEEAGRK